MRKLSKFKLISIIIFVLAVAGFLAYFFIFQKSFTGSNPTISMDKDTIEASIKVTNEELLKGVTANDDEDGDITSSVVVENVSKFTAPGVCTVNYAAFDSDGNVAKASRTLKYTDYVSPAVEITGPIYASNEYMDNPAQYIKVTDCIEGDISEKVKTTSDSAMSITSEDHKVTFSVVNKLGDKVVIPMDLPVNDTSVLALNNIRLVKYCETVAVGGSIDPLAYVESVQINGSTTSDPGEIAEAVQIDGTVDYATPGAYQLNYIISVNAGPEESDTPVMVNVTIPFIVIVR